METRDEEGFPITDIRNSSGPSYYVDLKVGVWLKR
jgi:hypothetical protein